MFGALRSIKKLKDRKMRKWYMREKVGGGGGGKEDGNIFKYVHVFLFCWFLHSTVRIARTNNSKAAYEETTEIMIRKI